VTKRPRSTAAKLGAVSTGHAAPFGIEMGDEPVPANLVFLPGKDSVEDLIGRVERGLFVTRFHYVNGLLDTRRATMTGMTRDGTYLIEDGKLGRAVGNLRFTQSVLEALGRVGGIGRELQAIPTHWLMVGNYLCPALLLRGFTFTGRSRGP
jgi:PmbA protein